MSLDINDDPNPLQLRPEILLHPNIPKPLHGLAPRTILGQAWWDEQRQIAYAKTGYRCAVCGVSKWHAEYHHWLEAHELYEFDYPRGRMVFSEIVALCHCCHNYIHNGRMTALVNKGEMSEDKQDSILRHGDAILRKAKLKKQSYSGECASWDEWRLVIDSQEYKGIFKNFDQWKNHYR